ncbi:MAG: metallophosphoesterase [Paludibacteraceae bacterium]|nr:metallophosphoesterase [Paludibacteraceae bacterium]
MKNYFRLLSFALCLSPIVLGLMSCGKPGNHDYLGFVWTRSETSDQRFEQSMEYNLEHGYDTICVANEDYRVYVCSDAHVDYSSYNMDTFTTCYLADHDAAPFCLCVGDLINATDNYPHFMAHVDRIQAAGRRMYSTPGNHDIFYNQWSIYRDYWHTSCYWLVVKLPSGARDLFICLDSANGTLGQKQMQWLRELLREKSKQGFRHLIVYTHTHLWKIDQSQSHTSNFAMEETYELADLFGRYGVDIVLQGHSHYRLTQVVKDVVYLRLDKIEDHYYNSYYTILQVGEHINWTFVPVGPQHEGWNEVRVPWIEK